MRSVLCHLTALAVALHALLGCCWHHAHACATCHSSLACDGSACHPEDECNASTCIGHHDSDGPHDSDGLSEQHPNCAHHASQHRAPPCQGRHACQGLCVSLAPAKAAGESALDLRASATLVVIESRRDVAACTSLVMHGHDPGRGGSAYRMHPWHQKLLI